MALSNIIRKLLGCEKIVMNSSDDEQSKMNPTRQTASSTADDNGRVALKAANACGSTFNAQRVCSRRAPVLKRRA